MSSTADKDRISQVQNSSEKAIQQAKQDLDHTISRFVAVRQIGSAGDVEAVRVNLHKHVLELYWRMRQQLTELEVWPAHPKSDPAEVDGAPIWRGHHPEIGEEIEITWLSDLDDWFDKSWTYEAPSDGPFDRTEESQQPLRLPLDASLAIADVLTTVYHECGWGAKPEDTTEHDEGDVDDLRELLKARGQEQAAEGLPGGDG